MRDSIELSEELRTRGRPRGFDPDQALARATERFRTRGFDGASLDQLAAATGLARPSLYAAFGNKRALYLAALDRIQARMERSFDQLAAAGLPPRAMLEALFRYVIDGYLTGETGPSGCVAVSTAATAAVTDALVRERLARFLATEDARVEMMLTAGGDDDAARHARVAMSVIHSLSVRARAGSPRAELEAIAADTIALLT